MSERVQAAAKKPEAKRENKVSQMQKTGFSQSISSPVEQILFLQRTIGNQAVGRLIESGALQAKLKIGQPGDIYEQEADRVAEQVMRMPEPQVANETKVSNPAWNIQRKCPGCKKETKIGKEEEEEKLQKKEAPNSTHEVTPELESGISDVRGGGQPLPEPVRAFFEPRFGADFSGVRVHTGTNAASAARDIDAHAFTHGQRVFFGEGKFQPDTPGGQKLLAHELTHTLQQKRISAIKPTLIESTTISQLVHPDATRAIFRQPANPLPTQSPPGDLPDLSQLEWNSEDDYVLYILSQDRLLALPSSNLLYRPQSGRAPHTGPPPEPWFGVPVVGKEGRRLVRTNTGTGIWFDAGGAPAALLPLSLAFLRARMSVSQIDKIIPIHGVHADHVRDLIPEIRRSSVRATNLILPDAWLQGTSGPLAQAVNTLRTSTDPDLVSLGYGAGWTPASPSMRNLPTTGIISLNYQEGNVRLRLLGTGEAFENYARAHAQGKVRAEIGDTASFLTLVQHPSSSFDISVVGDLRGGDILDLRDSMERIQAGSFQRAFSNVRVIDGLQHHLGVVRDNKDVDGVIALIEATMLKTGELTITVQTRENFRNQKLVDALYLSGVRVISLMEPKSGERPGSAVVNTEGTPSVKGSGIQDATGQRTAVQAYTRLGALRAALETVRNNGDMLDFKVGDRASNERELEIQINRLDNLLRELNQLNFNSLRPQSSQAKNLRSLQDIRTDLKKIEGIETRLSAEDYQLLERINQSAKDIRNLRREIERMKRTGEATPELYELIARLSPETAKTLMFDPQGKPLPRQQAYRNLSRQVELEQSGYARGGIAPWGAGGKFVSVILIAVDVGSQIASVISQTKQVNLSQNIMRFLHIIEWWLERGLEPELGAATDPIFSKAHIDIGFDKTQQKAIFDRIHRKAWENLPEDKRKKETELPEGVQSASGLDYLWIQSIPDDRWNGFNIWIDSHIRTYNEYAASFIDTNTKAVRSRGEGFENLEWEIHLGKFETSGWNTLEEKWVKSDRLTTIMQTAARRVVRETEAGIERTWERREEKRHEGPTIGPMPSAEEGQKPTFSIESLSPTLKARFKPKSSRKLFSEFDPDYEILNDKDWLDNEVFFLVFENYSSPAGYVLVSGGNYNTYAAIRANSTYQYDMYRVVKIRKPSRDPGDVIPRGGIFSNFPPDEDLSPGEKAAMEDFRNQRNGAKFQRYQTGNSDPYMGEVRYWFVGPNTRAVGLVRKEDLENK